MDSNYCEEDPQGAQKFEPHEVSAQTVCNPLFPENNMQLFVCVIYTSNVLDDYNKGITFSYFMQ